MKIPVALIDIDKEAIAGRPVSPAAMVRLEQRLRTDPATQKPIVVRPEGGRYALVSGRRTLLAALSIGSADIEARIRKGKSRAATDE